MLPLGIETSPLWKVWLAPKYLTALLELPKSIWLDVFIDNTDLAVPPVSSNDNALSLSRLTPIAKEERGKIHSVFTEQVKEHSKKPEISYQIIERLYPTLKRIELFARKKRQGWECWGNEINENTPTQTLLSQSANAENIIAIKRETSEVSPNPPEADFS